MSKGVRHGTPREMVYAMQMEKSVHQIRRLPRKRPIGVIGSREQVEHNNDNKQEPIILYAVAADNLHQ